MPALNFKVDWADAVTLGARLANCEIAPVAMVDLIPKRTTIRRPGRAHPGDTLYFYTGQRTKECRKLGEALCLFITSIHIARERRTGTPYIRLGAVRPGKELLSGPALERFARLDTAGRWDAQQFIAFFESTYGLPFIGELIGW